MQGLISGILTHAKGLIDVNWNKRTEYTSTFTSLHECTFALNVLWLHCIVAWNDVFNLHLWLIIYQQHIVGYFCSLIHLVSILNTMRCNIHKYVVNGLLQFYATTVEMYKMLSCAFLCSKYLSSKIRKYERVNDLCQDRYQRHP